mgnify:FL=1
MGTAEFLQGVGHLTSSPVLTLAPPRNLCQESGRWRALLDDPPDAAVLLMVAASELTELYAQLRDRGPVELAEPGRWLERRRVYLRAVTAEPEPPLALLRASAEALNASASLAEAMSALSALLSERLGWRSLGIRITVDSTATAAAEAALGAPHLAALKTGLPSVYYEGTPWPPLALPVVVDEAVSAVLSFAVPAAPPEGLLALANALSSQLAAVARRATEFRQGRTGRRRSDAASALALEELARTFSHELSQPLAAALNYAGALARTAAAEQVLRLAKRLQSQLMRARARLHELGGPLLVDVAPEPVDLGDLLNARLTRLVAPRGWLSLDLEPMLPPLQSYRPYLEQILDNLLDVACALADKGLYLQLQNDGSGLRLTMRGYRADQRERLGRWLSQPLHCTCAEGLGLRLAVSRALAIALGGELRLEDGEEGRPKLVLRVPLGGTPSLPGAGRLMDATPHAH